MKEEIKNEKEYIKGFNQSYLLEEYKPVLLTQILKTEKKNDFIQGMRDGKHQYEKEKTKTFSKQKSRLQELKRQRNHEKDKEQELEQ